ncbi:MAG TPA: M64 family metallopeptidase, partial [Phototrophicaceae bacterium]|nr:M64 family metallopeptidase [Phototrophicaceae bacterium]
MTDAEVNARFASFSRMTDAVTVRLLNSSGQVVYQTVQEIDGWLRGEFLIDPNNPQVTQNGTNIDGHWLPRTNRAFVVRVPDVGSGTTLQITPGFGSKTTTVLSVDAVAAQFIGKAVAPRSDSIPGWDHGDPANRVDVLIMGDGYTAAQEALFTADATDLANGWGDLDPYNEYSNYVNMRSVFTASNESGADRPVCPTDPPAGGEDDGTLVDTAFDATFCTAGIWRLLTVDDGQIFAAAASEPDWDHIFVVVNTPIYGGSGGDIAVLSTHALAIDILQHEYGHSFTKLADEYDTAYPGFPACSDTDGNQNNNCEANVTDVDNLGALKWAYWVETGTSIPTTDPLPDEQGAGLWEGARYLVTGMYRQCYNCMMRQLQRPFGYVDSETYVLRLYQGGWGVPADGITNIEPGTENPADSSFNLLIGDEQEVSAQILSPEFGPDATASWLLDGIEVQTDNLPNGSTASYTFTATVSGTFLLQLVVLDNSTLLHPSNQTSVASTNDWVINVGEGAQLLLNGGMENDNDANKVPDGWAAKGLTGDKIKCDTEDKIFAHSGACAFR